MFATDMRGHRPPGAAAGAIVGVDIERRGLRAVGQYGHRPRDPGVVVAAPRRLTVAAVGAERPRDDLPRERIPADPLRDVHRRQAVAGITARWGVGVGDRHVAEEEGAGGVPADRHLDRRATARHKRQAAGCRLAVGAVLHHRPIADHPVEVGEPRSAVRRCDSRLAEAGQLPHAVVPDPGGRKPSGQSHGRAGRGHLDGAVFDGDVGAEQPQLRLFDPKRRPRRILGGWRDLPHGLAAVEHPSLVIDDVAVWCPEARERLAVTPLEGLRVAADGGSDRSRGRILLGVCGVTRQQEHGNAGRQPSGGCRECLWECLFGACWLVPHDGHSTTALPPPSRREKLACRKRNLAGRKGGLVGWRACPNT